MSQCILNLINMGWEPELPAYVNQHPFSIGPDKVVYFTKSNLMYDSGVYKLQQYPWSHVENNGNIGSLNSTSKISLFTWASSGYNNFYPWSTTYLGPDIEDRSWTSDSNNWDWAVNNNVYDYNGTLTKNLRVLTEDEFRYVIEQRGNFGEFYDFSVVDNNFGVILFSDDYIHPGTCSERGEDQIYSYEEWIKMEEAGAVFLPLCGRRTNLTVSEFDETGYYLTSSCAETSWNGTKQIYCFYIFYDVDFSQYNTTVTYMFNAMDGHAVRLVYEK